MSRPPTLSILDPTSLFGRELIERAAQTLQGSSLRLFQTQQADEHLLLEAAAEASLVQPLREPDELYGSKVLVVTDAPPTPLAAALATWLSDHPEVVVLDCTQPGILADAVQLWVALPETHPPRRWYHLVDPALHAPFQLVRALVALAPKTCQLTLLSPAATFGADAIEELAVQGATRLSGRPAPRPVCLPGVLAFDIAPAAHERLQALAAQLAAIMPGVPCEAQVMDTGVFHGHLATASLTFQAPVRTERVRSLLRAAPVLRLARANERIGMSAAVAKDTVVCGGLHVVGASMSAWLASDGQRLSAAAAAGLLSALMAT